MADRQPKQLELLLEGEAGHNGNVLATTFVVKLHRLLNLLHRMERLNTGARTRRTEFEIVKADKFNPTVLALKPVPKVMDFNPAVAFDWTIEQIDAVANGRPLDKRVDFGALYELHEIAVPPRDGAYSKFLMRSDDRTIVIDHRFSEKALVAANAVRELERPHRWNSGVSYGHVTGDLRAVLDETGEQEFVIHPPVGPDRIVCRFPAEKRGLMNSYLFRVVTVEGNLHYGEESPHPTLVEMTDIRPRPENPIHLSDLRGLFEGIAPPEDAWVAAG